MGGNRRREAVVRGVISRRREREEVRESGREGVEGVGEGRGCNEMRGSKRIERECGMRWKGVGEGEGGMRWERGEGEGTCNFLLQKWADTVTIWSSQPQSQPQSYVALLHETGVESSAAGWRGYAVSYIITASKQITMLGPVMIVKLLSVEEYCGWERGNTLIKYTV